MTLLLATSVGVLFATGCFMLTRRSLVKLVLGLALLGHAANLLIFAAARPVPGRSPLIARGAETLAEPFSDPLPAALILTAIVIGFGIVSYTIVLVQRVSRELGTDDVEALNAADG